MTHSVKKFLPSHLAKRKKSCSLTPFRCCLLTASCKMAVTAFKTILVALALIPELQHFTAKVTASPLLSDTILSSPLPLQYEVNTESKENKLFLHKCCDSGQVYHAYSGVIGSSRCVNYSITSYPLIEVPQKLFLTTEEDLHRYEEDDFEVVNGFPVDCHPDSIIFLEPELLTADKFYLDGSGQLIVPHRFWFLRHEDYCIDEFFEDEDFKKARRIALICTDHLNIFPSTAINEAGKLQLDFIDSTASSALSSIAGNTVVRKCCDPNEIYSLDNRVCVTDKQQQATHFFEDLRASENDSLFFRIGLLLQCDYYQLHTMKFQLTSSGSLQIDEDIDGKNSSVQLFSTDNYCIDDFIMTNPAGLPGSSNLALFCSEKPPQPSELELSTDTSSSIHEIHYEELKEINVPKCCVSDSVVEQETCRPFRTIEETLDAQSIVTNALNFYLLDSYNFSSILIPNISLSCGFGTRHPLIPTSAKNNEGIVKFKSLKENDQLAIIMHFFVENYWDFEIKLQSFCLDLELLRSLKEVVYQPQVFYCISQSQVSGHYPILLGISSAALLATFIIYFFVPTSGSAKLVTLMGGSRSRKSTVPTMAKMLTGRILLCHVFTLAVTFISLAISQDNRIPSGDKSCIVLGFIIYGASIASFSWLTVYCFDYCRIFRGSFKVSNEMLFIPYSLFGWGFPLLALVAASVAQFQSTHYGISGTVNPNMGLLRCWFAGGTSSLIFFYIPVSILMFLNISFFLSLLFNPNLMNCWKKNRTTPLRSNRTKAKESKEKQDMKMAIKLFFITGVPWVFEIVAWVPTYLPEKHSILYEYSKYFLEVGNLLNSLRGVIIFIIFILLQRDVRRYLKHRFTKVFVSKKSSKMNDNSGANAESTSASTQQPTSESRL